MFLQKCNATPCWNLGYMRQTRIHEIEASDFVYITLPVCKCQSLLKKYFKNINRKDFFLLVINTELNLKYSFMVIYSCKHRCLSFYCLSIRIQMYNLLMLIFYCSKTFLPKGLSTSRREMHPLSLHG